MKETHVVFGAGGALGSAIVRRLVEQGLPVRAVVRNEERARRLQPPLPEFVVGDAAQPQSVRANCQDAAVIYDCVNLPYQEWPSAMQGLAFNLMDGALSAQALLVFPSCSDVYGPLKQTPATEAHELAATGKKGQLRNVLETRLLKACRAGDLRLAVPRFPLFYGVHVTKGPLAPIFELALTGEKASWPGKLDVPHDFICVEDAAAACVLVGAAENSCGQIWHVPGAGPLTGRQFTEMAFKAAGTKPNLGSMGRGGLTFRGLFTPGARETAEMLYEFEGPHVMDGSRFAAAFPAFTYSPHVEAMWKTVQWWKERINLGYAANVAEVSRKGIKEEVEEAVPVDTGWA